MPFESESVTVRLLEGDEACLLTHTYDDGRVAFIARPAAGAAGEEAALQAIERLTAILRVEGKDYQTFRRRASLDNSGTRDAVIVPNALHRKFDLLAAVERDAPWRPVLVSDRHHFTRPGKS